MTVATMSSTSNPRKRPAPGAPPTTPLAPMPQPFTVTQAGQIPWANGVPENNGLVDNSSRNPSAFGSMPTQNQFADGQALPAESTALARRDGNQALVPAHTAYDPSADLWGHFGENSALVQQPLNGDIDGNDSVQHLEKLALRVKTEAQGKRKQIPPFVQKLSSFLDKSSNTDLIRWSETGDSFIVLDEDEFAKTLIPELFKHNNYASFVRQLNMYGFHKRVGLSDNSMKASERKNKSPSEYYNPYFRRGHPNLLWLINKPKSGNSKKKVKKEDGADADSEEEGATEEKSNNVNYVDNHTGSGVRTATAPEAGSMPRQDNVYVLARLDRIQNQQALIWNLVKKMDQENKTIKQQIVQFQNQHAQHERSMKAVLTFLGNIFRKSLEESGGTQSVQEILANLMPAAKAHLHGQNMQTPQGSVVDLGDYVNQNAADSALSPMKRAQRLLPPIPQETGKASTVSPSPGVSPKPQAAGGQASEMGTVTEIFDNAADVTSPSPAYVHDELGANILSPGGSGVNAQAKTTNVIPGIQETPSSTTPNATTMPTAQNTQPLSPTTMAASLAMLPSLSNFHSPSMLDVQDGQATLNALQELNQGHVQTLEELVSMLRSPSPSVRNPGPEASASAGAPDEFDRFFDPTAFEDPNSGLDLGSEDLAFSGLDGNDFNFSVPGTSDLQGITDFQGMSDLDDSFPPGQPRNIESMSTTATEGNSPAVALPEDVPKDLEGTGTVPDPKRRRVE